MGLDGLDADDQPLGDLEVGVARRLRVWRLVFRLASAPRFLSWRFGEDVHHRLSAGQWRGPACAPPHRDEASSRACASDSRASSEKPPECSAAPSPSSDRAYSSPAGELASHSEQARSGSIPSLPRVRRSRPELRRRGQVATAAKDPAIDNDQGWRDPCRVRRRSHFARAIVPMCFGADNPFGDDAIIRGSAAADKGSWFVRTEAPRETGHRRPTASMMHVVCLRSGGSTPRAFGLAA